MMFGGFASAQRCTRHMVPQLTGGIVLALDPVAGVGRMVANLTLSQQIEVEVRPVVGQRLKAVRTLASM